MTKKTPPILFVAIVILVAFFAVFYAFFFTSRTPSLDLPKQTNVAPLNVNAMVAQTDTLQRYPNSGNVGKVAVRGTELWIANGHALVRYDTASGKRKVYTEADGLLNNATRDVTVVGDDIWVASQTSGISIFHPKTDTWDYFTTENGLVNDGNPIFAPDNEYLWFATFEGLGRYSITTKQWKNWTEADGIPFQGVQDIVVNNNAVWIYVTPNAYTKGGVLKYDKKTDAWSHLEDESSVFTVNQLAGPMISLVGKNLYAVAYTGRERILFTQDIETGIWTSRASSLELERSLHLDQPIYDGHYWDFGDFGEITLVSQQTKKSTALNTAFLQSKCPKNQAAKFVPNGRATGYLFSIVGIGREVWIPCPQGFSRYDLDQQVWSFTDTSGGTPSDIRSILAVHPDGLLVSSNLGIGVLSRDGRTWKGTPGSEAWEVYFAAWGKNDMYFVDMADVSEYDGTGETKFWHVRWPNTTPEKLEGENNTRPGTLLITDSQGNVWQAGSDLSMLENGRRTRTIAGPKDEQYSLQKAVFDGQTLWAATFSNLYRLDMAAEQWEKIPVPQSPQGLVAPRNIAVANEKLAMNPSTNKPDGIYMYDPTTAAWKHYSAENDLLTLKGIRALAALGDRFVVASEGEVAKGARENGDVSVIRIDGSYTYRRDGIELLDRTPPKLLSASDGFLGGEIQDLFSDTDRVWYWSSDGISSMTLDSW